MGCQNDAEEGPGARGRKGSSNAHNHVLQPMWRIFITSDAQAFQSTMSGQHEQVKASLGITAAGQASSIQHPSGLQAQA